MAEYLEFKQAKCKNCYKCLRECPVKAIDVKDLIIVNQGDVTLVCSEKSAQRVKELVHDLDNDPNMRKFL